MLGGAGKDLLSIKGAGGVNIDGINGILTSGRTSGFKFEVTLAVCLPEV